MNFVLWFCVLQIAISTTHLFMRYQYKSDYRNVCRQTPCFDNVSCPHTPTSVNIVRISSPQQWTALGIYELRHRLTLFEYHHHNSRQHSAYMSSNIRAKELYGLTEDFDFCSFLAKKGKSSFFSARHLQECNIGIDTV